MTYLFDVNLLIALIDPLHVHHGPARRWFEEVGGLSWATCPLVENGTIRIVGGSSYTSNPFGCGDVADVLERLRGLGSHQFWPDDISLLDRTIVDRVALTSSGRITDTYLLALAVSRGGRLATFDRRIAAGGVRDGVQALHILTV